MRLLVGTSLCLLSLSWVGMASAQKLSSEGRATKEKLANQQVDRLEAGRLDGPVELQVPSNASPHPEAPPPRSEVTPTVAELKANPNLWVPGYWSWEGSEFAWQAGGWVPKIQGHHFVPAHWAFHHGWVFVPAGWAKKGSEQIRFPAKPTPPQKRQPTQVTTVLEAPSAPAAPATNVDVYVTPPVGPRYRRYSPGWYSGVWGTGLWGTGVWGTGWSRPWYGHPRYTTRYRNRSSRIGRRGFRRNRRIRTRSVRRGARTRTRRRR